MNDQLNSDQFDLSSGVNVPRSDVNTGIRYNSSTNILTGFLGFFINERS